MPAVLAVSDDFVMLSPCPRLTLTCNHLFCPCRDSTTEDRHHEHRTIHRLRRRQVRRFVRGERATRRALSSCRPVSRSQPRADLEVGARHGDRPSVDVTVHLSHTLRYCMRSSMRVSWRHANAAACPTPRSSPCAVRRAAASKAVEIPDSTVAGIPLGKSRRISELLESNRSLYVELFQRKVIPR